MTEHEIERLIDRAAEKGAKKALHDLGLSDDEASGDVKELRTLLSSWREIRSTAIKTVTRIVTTALLGLIAAGIYFSNWGGNGR